MTPIPAGWKLVAVNEAFDDLMFWLDRCHNKGHLDNCFDLVAPWEAFEYGPAPSPLSAAPASAKEEAKDERQAFEAWHKREFGSYVPGVTIHYNRWLGWEGRASVAAPAAGDALPTIKGAAITGGYVVVTPAGWGEDKAQKVRDAILRLFPVNPAYTPKPEDAQVPQQGEA